MTISMHHLVYACTMMLKFASGFDLPLGVDVAFLRDIPDPDNANRICSVEHSSFIRENACIKGFDWTHMLSQDSDGFQRLPIGN